MLNKQFLLGITFILTLLWSCQSLNVSVRNDINTRTLQRIRDVIDKYEDDNDYELNVYKKNIKSYLNKYNNLSEIQKKELERIYFSSWKNLLLSNEPTDLYNIKIKSYIYSLLDSLFEKVQNQDELDMLVSELIYNINQKLDSKNIDNYFKNLLINVRSYINLKYIEASSS